MRFLEWFERESGAPAAEDLPQIPVSRAPAGPAGPWRAILELADRRLAHPAPYLSEDATEALFHWNMERGADPSLRKAWSSISAGRGLAVVTGQQPGILGGPLYSLYKLLTAVALARRLERVTGAPALAIFWVVGDDSDFGEVASAWWPHGDGRVARLRDAAQPPSGTLIGALPAERQRKLLEEILEADRSGSEASLAPAGERARSHALLEEAIEVGQTWSGIQASLFYRLLPDLPFVVVDGAHPAVLRSQTGWLERAMRWPLAEWLRTGAEEARAAGFEPPLDPALGERSVYRIEGDRREPWDGSEPATVLLAPNVVLRPLIQDLLFPNVATVCGPSEIRYRAQLSAVYRGAEVPEPARIPRLRGILVPRLDGPRTESAGGAAAESARVADAAGSESAGGADAAVGVGADADAAERYREAAADPQGFLDRLVERSLPRDLLDPVEQNRRETRAGLEVLRPSLASYDSSLGQLLDSVIGKVDFQIGRVLEGIEAKARHRFLSRNPHLARWREFMRPRDGEQERSLSLLTPYLSEGMETSQVVGEAAMGHLVRILERGLRPAEALFLLERYGSETKEARHV